MTVPRSAVAKALGVTTGYASLITGRVRALPQRIAVLAPGALSVTYSTTKRQVFSAQEAGEVYGFGSPIHLMVRQLLPATGGGVGSIPVTVYPLAQGATASPPARITPTGTPTAAASYRFGANNLYSEPVAIAAGQSIASICTDIAAAINSAPNLPFTATATATYVDLPTKWRAFSVWEVDPAVDGPTDAGLTFTLTVVGGSGAPANPSIVSALAQMGDVWETLVLVGLVDNASYAAIEAAGESRWGALTRKPFIAFHGSTFDPPESATFSTATRTTDRTNVRLVCPGSKEFSFVFAAAQVAQIAIAANANPARDYAGLPVRGILPGLDGDQWDYAERDYAVKRGCSTIEVEGGVVKLADIITHYAPEGDATPAYRFVSDIVKVQNIIYNLNELFNGPGWAGAPLIPDSQTTANRSARKPRHAKAALCALIDNLALEAIISDPDMAKATVLAEIDAANQRRLNVSFTVAISGSVSIISVDFNFGFYFGTPSLAA